MLVIELRQRANKAMFTVISGKQEHEPIVIQDAQGQQWRLVSAETSGCTFEAVEHREIGYAPRTLQIAVVVVQSLMGWYKPQSDHHLTTAPDGFGVVVTCDDRDKGYAIAEPIWYKRTDDPIDDHSLERTRMQQALDRDCDRVNNFAMSARYGCGALI